jgi:hypothetical protein
MKLSFPLLFHRLKRRCLALPQGSIAPERVAADEAAGADLTVVRFKSI